MKHARRDYDRIQDPALHDLSLLSNGSTPIAADEPVFLIRGQDAIGAAAVRAWAQLHLASGGDPALSDAALRHAAQMEAWPKKQKATAPHEMLREAAR
jgi:hypothetical protein